MNAVIGTLGITAAGTVINSITTLSTNVFTLMGYIKLSPHIAQSDIMKVLLKSDIETTIRLLQSIISEIPHYYNNSTSVVIALKNVQEIISKMSFYKSGSLICRFFLVKFCHYNWKIIY